MQYCQCCDIAHEENSCPLCAANERIKELEEAL